jgi:tetratricopeptide (TPR) repeat protein
MSDLLPEDREPFELLTSLGEGPGPARRISARHAAVLVRGALDAFGLPPEPVSEPKPSPATGAWKGLWVTGGGLVLAGVAALGLWRANRPVAPPPAPPRVIEAPRGPEPRPAPPPPEAPAVVEAAPPAAPPAVPTTVPTAPTPAVEPEDLLRRANERRAAGQWREAESLYQRVLQGAPGTNAAYVALVASAGLRLEHLDDARGALRQYQQARRTRPHGMLGEEVDLGLAETWRALDEPRQEAQALTGFLQAHPDSPRAAAARRRLGALTTTPP